MSSGGGISLQIAFLTADFTPAGHSPAAMHFLLALFLAQDGADLEFFESKIRPVLAEHCIGCHGAKKQKGGLRLDSRAAWAKGGDSGPAVVPGKADRSLL